MSPLPQESTALARILRAQPGFDQLPDADFAELSKQPGHCGCGPAKSCSITAPCRLVWRCGHRPLALAGPR